MFLRKIVRRLVLVLTCFLLARLATSTLTCRPPHKSELRVTILDVGKGDAMVIETPNGKTLVVDTGGTLPGGDDQGNRTIAPFLRERGIRRIDALLLTHPHADHIGGAVSLLKQFPVGRLYDNGYEASSPRVRRYRGVAQEQNVPLTVVRRGYELKLDRALTIRALAPPRSRKTGDERQETDKANNNKNAPDAKNRIPNAEHRTPMGLNDTSIVLRIDYGKTAFLLTGDAEAASEAEMIASEQTLRVDVLKVGHHGSRTATSEAFIKAVQPHYALISVDAKNRSGYPHRDVLNRLSEAGAQVFRTDQNGNVTCLADGQTVRVEAARR